ncbi:MAG: sulfatase [Thermoplasmata archaeon]|nr:MAG: sulfatase [Thermoplasmata archaeon]
MDEVRADHISCYGYKKINTGNIDRIALEGVRFKTCIATSILTPVSHASLLSGLYPPSHNLRGPFDKFDSQTLPKILRNEGYKTAGFVGNSMLGADVGFSLGFDVFDEPKEGYEFMWELHSYKDPNHPDVRFPWGNWWIDRAIEWIEDNLHESFFVFGHFFHTHEGSERQLLEMGLIDRDSPRSEYGYYDEKIKLCDDRFISTIIRTLQKNGIYDDTTLVITADHGTTLGERELPPIPWRENVTYPQHTTMYEPDIRVPLIIKDRDLPRNIVIDDPVRHIDIFPTLLRLLRIKTPAILDGNHLIPLIYGEKTNGFKTYIEDLFLFRGPGALQSIRSERFKYIINQTTLEEEFYDLLKDPKEEENRISDLSLEEKIFVERARCEAESYYAGHKQKDVIGQDTETQEIMERLRALGYISDVGVSTKISNLR